jgi:hypothetical protein
MNKKIIIIFSGLSLALMLLAGSAYGQGRGQQPPTYTPTVTAWDKLPDWSGVWQMVGPTIFDTATQTGKGGSVDVGVREHPPFNAEWEAEYQKSLAKRDAARLPDVISNCGVPAGWPRMFNLPDPYEFVIRPEQFWILTENGPNVMRVYTDGRKHLEDQWETYTGDSVGHWEGDTLVFTTVATKGNRDSDVLLDRTGLVLSDKAHATTRMRKTDDKTIEAVLTIEDPKALTKPWVVTKHFRKLPLGTRIYDYGCAENNRNPVDEKSGKTLVLDPNGKPLNVD